MLLIYPVSMVNLINYLNMNIFIAKMNFRTTRDVLRETFEKFGEVTSAKVIIDHATGRSKGYGFVEMANDQEAIKAIDELNNSELEGSRIIVKIANQRTERNSGQKNNRSRR